MIKCIDSIIENLKNAQDFFENLLKWPISFLEIEQQIRDFVNEKIVKPLFEVIFHQLFILLKNQSKKIWKENWYKKIRTNKRKVKIYTWQKINISTHYATNDWAKWEKKWTKNIFLEQLWFVDWCSPLLAGDIVSSWLYCPSFQLASEVLSTRWVKIDDNKIASLTYK